MSVITDPQLEIIKQWTLPDGQTATAYQWESGVDAPVFMVADGHAQDANIPLTIWCHGSGGGPTKLTTATEGWVPFRDGWLMAGGAIMEARGSQVSVLSGTQHWGRTVAREGYHIPYQEVQEWIHTDKVLVVGTSMGGTISKYLATRDPIVKPKVIGLIDAAGIYNFEAEFDQGVAVDGKDRFDLAHYYNTDWPDKPSFMAATADTDPARYDQTVFNGLKVFIIVGDADVTAVKERAGEMFWNRFKPGSTSTTYTARFADESQFVVVPGAGHATQSMYQDPRILNWALARIGKVPVTPTVPTFWEVTEEGIVANNGIRYLVESGTVGTPKRS